jgi:DnaJ-class molecular chaperone
MWGKDPGKPGGADYRAPHDATPDDEGPLACGHCGGTGAVVRQHHSNKGQEPDYMDCPKCDGTGQVQ